MKINQMKVAKCLDFRWSGMCCWYRPRLPYST